MVGLHPGLHTSRKQHLGRSPLLVPGDVGSGAAPVPGMPVRLFHLDGKPVVLSADGLPIGELNAPLNPYLRGLVRASVMAEPAKVSLTYLGPDDLWVE